MVSFEKLMNQVPYSLNASMSLIKKKFVIKMFKRFLDVKFLNRSNISNSQKILRAYSYVWLRTACIFHLILTITP